MEVEHCYIKNVTLHLSENVFSSLIKYDVPYVRKKKSFFKLNNELVQTKCFKIVKVNLLKISLSVAGAI